MNRTEYNQRYLAFARNVGSELNMEDALKMVPEEKHYWITELIESKKSKLDITKRKKKLKEESIKREIEGGIVNLSKQTLDKIENTDKVQEINSALEELELTIEYLEYIVKNVSFIGNDIKNILTLRQLQEL
jgi:hypothetical protein